MSKPRKFQFHLFNCDNTYKLEPVEQLLTATEKKLETELGIHVDSVKKHPFRLAQMSDMVTKTIPTLEMDMAFFVVHAHESRLSINEDNAGIGYANIYRALLQATGGNVIIVIGGDDNYKESEEDREVISRWAKRKISSQFSEECLDGRKSFIFSWNKGHRAIHEEALLHHFDPKKKGHKFNYQPPERKPSKAGTPPAERATKQVHPPKLYRSFTLPAEKGKQLKDRSKMPLSPKSPLYNDKAVTGQRSNDNLPCSKTDIQPQAEARREDFGGYNFDRTSGNTTPFYSNLGARPKEMHPQSLERPKAKDLAILGCNVLESCMQDVRKVFQDISPKLNLSEPPPIENFQSLVAVKEHLMDNRLRFCVLVVDADRIKYAHGHQPQESSEYRQLLETAVKQVDLKVIILICGSRVLSQGDKTRVHKVIKRFINETEKVFIVWPKSGKFLAVDPDVLAQLLALTSGVKTSHLENFQAPSTSWPAHPGQPQGYQEHPAEWEIIRETNGQFNTQQPQGTVAIYSDATATSITGHSELSAGPTVILKSKLRRGEISYDRLDLERNYQGFIVPDDINETLLQKYFDVSEAGVKIVKDSYGKLGYIVELRSEEDPKEEGIEIGDNETLRLNTLVRYGQVSFDNDDLKYRYPGWQVPQYIMNSLKRDHGTTRKADLFVISDGQEKLRYKVIIGKYNKALDSANKAFRKVTNFKS